MSDIRTLAPPDIPRAVQLNRKAGWNQTEEDWARLLELEPDGCFGLEIDGELAATTTAVCYGRDLAWIGMVLTDPKFRRRGLARRLMEHALHYLGRRGIAWIKLDATDMGRPLYLSLGFEDECSIERWSGAGTGTGVSACQPFELDAPLDREAFGADRTILLRNLAHREAASLPGAGYVMARPGANAVFLGPCVARSPASARSLLQWVLARQQGEAVFWDLLPGNREAVRLAREFDFAPRRKLARMVRRGVAGAAPLAHNDSLVFAIAGFEYG